jgi:hypothetical protein
VVALVFLIWSLLSLNTKRTILTGKEVTETKQIPNQTNQNPKRRKTETFIRQNSTSQSRESTPQTSNAPSRGAQTKRSIPIPSPSVPPVEAVVTQKHTYIKPTPSTTDPMLPSLRSVTETPRSDRATKQEPLEPSSLSPSVKHREPVAQQPETQEAPKPLVTKPTTPKFTVVETSPSEPQKSRESPQPAKEKTTPPSTSAKQQRSDYTEDVFERFLNSKNDDLDF